MALADVLRERVSRRGRTAEVACGLLGTVTVEALPPRECAALGMRDGGRALLYAACRDLQTAGETLRREGRLFTPAEVTAYVSDEEAAAAARTAGSKLPQSVISRTETAHRQKARKSDMRTCRTTGRIWQLMRRPRRKSDLTACRKTRFKRPKSDLVTCGKRRVKRPKSDVRTCGTMRLILRQKRR